ncbi:MAG TPA: molybdopterin-binding protein [Verrucomicrobiae bacterium]|nr:molybdopterin-binding protein [Verrucomicrobiae bacterium]
MDAPQPAPDPAPPAQSWVIAVGDELLDGHTTDTNSTWLAGALRGTPFPCRRITIIPDAEPVIVSELESAVVGPAARVFLCGGLGPTPDDRTLTAVAQAFGRPLREHPAALAHIQGVVARMHAAGWVATPSLNPGNRKMALVPEGATVLPNRMGMAPPLALPLPGPSARWLLVIPGVPRELRTVVAEEIIPIYCPGAASTTSEEVTFYGIGESTFFPLLTELGLLFPEVRFGSYPRPSGGELVIRATASDPDRVRLALGELRRLSADLPPRPFPRG